MTAPTAGDVRRSLAALDVARQKIVAGMLAVMIREPARVRDREWMAERLTEMVVHGAGLEADSPGDGVRAVQEYLHVHAGELLAASLLLFQRVGLDLAPRAAEGFELEDALRLGLAYLPSIEGEPQAPGG